MTNRLLLCLLLTALPAVAQNLPVPDGKGRILRVFDLQRAWPTGFEDEAERTGTAHGEPDPSRQRLAAFLRPFVEPPLGPGDDLVVLGGRWLTLLGQPAQVAGLERFFEHAVATRDELVTLTVTLVTVPPAFFDRTLRPLLVARAGTATTYEMVLSAATATELQRTIETSDAEVLSAPRVTLAPLQRATVSMLEQISYLKDYTLVRRGDELIADPLVDVVHDGVHAELFAVLLADGRLGVQCEVETQTVLRPIHRVQTDIGAGQPVTIELPRTTGVRFQQTAQMAPGEVVALASQKVDGDYLLALVEAKLEK